MTWFKVDDNLAFHSKTLIAGNAAMGMWVRAGSWSAQHLTEGFIPWHIVDALGTRKQAGALVKAGLWTSGDEGCQFWQWSEEGRQPSKETVLAERAAARERQKRAREKAASRRDGSVTDGVTSPDVTVPPSRPVPTSSTEAIEIRPVLQTAAEQTDGLVFRARLFGFDSGQVHRELARVMQELPDDDTVMQVATTILGRAKRVPDDATKYVVGSIRKHPEEAQQLAFGGAA